MTTTVHAIPTIDIAPLLTGDAAARADIARQLGEAAQTYGFMKLVGHGVPEAVIADTFSAAQDFFGQSEEAKAPYQERKTNRGFQPMFDNAKPGQKPSGQEAFSMGHPIPPEDPALLSLPFYAATPWPADVPLFRERLETCYHEMFKVGERVLEAFAVHLGAPHDFFANVSRNTYSNMRVVHYPPQEAVQHIADEGVRAHEDQGLITLLIQDMNGGLEVLGPEKDWLPVVPDERAIVLNVAKLLTRWTNGRLKSALHRVINRSGRERYSIPLFVHPNYHQVIDARDFAAGEPVRFDPIVAGDQVYKNFAGERKSWAALTS
ncbi:MAG: isopenicillin N synthase family oxygenase [Burkholderiales bacterium]|jgi:isopenicillin N synthase-like dioxygenase|nr:isopenicillin N synthase family oxygenase [Burkholderiales bacterium]